MQGRRVPWRPGFPGNWAQPGDYMRIPDGEYVVEDGCWYAMAPSGGCCTLQASVHQITEHADGTISVSPSIVMPDGWHGHLTDGVWR